jgi:hypothetical protein
MMKRMQSQILQKTLNVQRAYKSDREDLTPAEKALLKRLSDEQGKLSDLMRKFTDKFDQQKKAQDPKRSDE